jgi:hypothetical protein
MVIQEMRDALVERWEGYPGNATRTFKQSLHGRVDTRFSPVHVCYHGYQERERERQMEEQMADEQWFHHEMNQKKRGDSTEMDWAQVWGMPCVMSCVI